MQKLVLVILGLLALVTAGCRGTKIVTVEVPKIEKEYVASVDTVHQFDSIWVYNEKYRERDTVFITKVNEKYKYLYKMRVDTLVRCDTITLIDTKQIEALAKENDSLKATMHFYRYLGMSLLVIIGMMGLYFLFKK